MLCCANPKRTKKNYHEEKTHFEKSCRPWCASHHSIRRPQLARQPLAHMRLPPLQVICLGRLAQPAMPHQALRNLLQDDLRRLIFPVTAGALDMCSSEVVLCRLLHSRQCLAAIHDFLDASLGIGPRALFPVIELEVLEPFVDV